MKTITILLFALPLFALAYTSNEIYVENTYPYVGPGSLNLPLQRTQIEKMILATFGTEKALEIAKCESGLNPSAINDNPKTGDYSVGLFQINLYGDLAKERPSREWLLIPENNIQFAYELYLKRGWGAWGCND